MKSMTGYGEATVVGSAVRITVQLRTLNHRNLDMQLRVPRLYLSIEEEIRNKLRQRISRGRVELFLGRSPLKGQGRRLEVDEELLNQYLLALRGIKSKRGLEGEVDLSLLSKFPDLFYFREQDVLGESERSLVLKAVELSLRELDRAREREGRITKRDIHDQVRGLRKIAGVLRREAKKILVRLKESLPSRETVESWENQKGRSDIVNSALKGDINEEVVRFGSHVEGLLELLRGREPVGKKMEFLLQEVQRELSTISAKAPHLSVVRLVLAGKERVEKMREQAQNIE
jgi:uncharacterized protein (TIGR00255 family)